MPAVYDLLTVGEHLEFIARAYSLTGWEDYAASLLERFELDDKRITRQGTVQGDAAKAEHLLLRCSIVRRS